MNSYYFLYGAMVSHRYNLLRILHKRYADQQQGVADIAKDLCKHTMDNLRTVVKEKDKKIAELETELQTTKEAFASMVKLDLDKTAKIKKLEWDRTVSQTIREALEAKVQEKEDAIQAMQAHIDDYKESTDFVIKQQDEENKTLKQELEASKDAYNALQKRLDEVKDYSKKCHKVSVLYKDQRDLRFYECSTLTKENKKLRGLCTERFEKIRELEETVKKLQEENDELKKRSDYYGTDQVRLTPRTVGEELLALTENHYWKTLYDNLDEYCKSELPKLRKKIDDLTAECNILNFAYPNIMLLPEGMSCPWKDAEIITQHYFEIKGQRYVLWGKGVILEMGTLMTCNKQ